MVISDNHRRSLFISLRPSQYRIDALELIQFKILQGLYFGIQRVDILFLLLLP